MRRVQLQVGLVSSLVVLGVRVCRAARSRSTRIESSRGLECHRRPSAGDAYVDVPRAYTPAVSTGLQLVCLRVSLPLVVSTSRMFIRTFASLCRQHGEFQANSKPTQGEGTDADTRRHAERRSYASIALRWRQQGIASSIAALSLSF